MVPPCGEQPTVPLDSFSVLLDGFLEHPAPFKLFWKIDSEFKLCLEVVQFLDLFCNLTKKKKKLKFWGSLYVHEGSSHLHGFTFMLLLSWGLLQRSSGDAKWPKFEREAQDRRVRGRFLGMV